MNLHISKRSLWAVLPFIAGALVLLAIALLAPQSAGAAVTSGATCGDGICVAGVENNDLCPADCQCNDNSLVEPGEGCNCKDVVCESAGEKLASAVGTFCGATNPCTDGLQCYNGVCWENRVIDPSVDWPAPGCQDGTFDLKGQCDASLVQLGEAGAQVQGCTQNSVGCWVAPPLRN